MNRHLWSEEFSFSGPKSRTSPELRDEHLTVNQMVSILPMRVWTIDLSKHKVSVCGGIEEHFAKED